MNIETHDVDQSHEVADVTPVPTGAVQRKRPSDEPTARKYRMQKYRLTKNTKKGKIEFGYKSENEKNDIFKKMQDIKSMMAEGKEQTAVHTFDMLQRVFDFYLNMNLQDADVNQNETGTCNFVPEYQRISEEDSSTEELYVVTRSSIQCLLDQAQYHDHHCQHKELTVQVNSRLGHVMLATVTCKSGHTYSWTSTPKVAGGKLYGNLRVAHGYLTSGMLAVHHEKFCQQAKIGHLGLKYMNGLLYDMAYSTVVSDLAKRSMEDAVHEEILVTQVSEGDNAERGI